MAILDSINSGAIAHQCNCMGYMGCGVALAIRRKYPVVYQRYYPYGHRTGNGQLNLGMVQFVRVSSSLHIVNLMAQFGVSRQRRMTDYGALDACLEKMRIKCDMLGITDFWFPYKMGSGNAGGDWTIVERSILGCFPNAQFFFNPSGLRK